MGWASLLIAFHLCGGLAAASPETLKAADEAFRHRREPGRARRALATYEALYQKQVRLALSWRLAMASHFVAFYETPNAEERKRLYKQGLTVGQEGIELDGDCVPCRFWTAVNLALYGQEVGPLKMLGSLRPILTHLRKVTRLEPGYAYGGAYRIMALIYKAIPGWLGGGIGKAKQYLEQAIEASPAAHLNYLFLANLYYDDLGDFRMAQTIVRQGLTHRSPSPLEVESYSAWRELRKKSWKRKVEVKTPRG